MHDKERSPREVHSDYPPSAPAMTSPDYSGDQEVSDPTVMIIDDEPTTVDILARHLENNGYRQLIKHSDPETAIDTIRSMRPDVVLLDVIMPGVDGLDVLEAVRSSGEFQELPVVILTASHDQQLKRRALDLGATDFLNKPVDASELVCRVANALAVKAHREVIKTLGEHGDRRADPSSSEATTPPIAELAAPPWQTPKLWQSFDQEVKPVAKVMVVDDEPVNLDVVRAHLENEGYQQFVTTEDAQHAVEIIRVELPDIVLLDIMMPHTSGLEILSQIRADPELSDLPVVILTAASDREIKRQALELGATDFLAKPVDSLDLLPRVRNALVLKFHQDRIKQYARQLEGEVRRYVDKVKDYAGTLQKANRVLKRSESAAQAATRAKSTFLANMSHEIRTPMTAILGFTEILLENISDSGQVDAAQTVKRNAEHLLDVINGVLDFSKIEAGRLEVEIVPCNPLQLVQEVVDLLQNQAEMRGLELGLRTLGEVPDTIRTDPTCLRRILINLIGNAIKFTSTGSVDVRVRTLPHDRKAELEFRIVDSGIGIEPGQLARLFQPFTQADSSVSRKFGGTGLGLAISRQLVEKLGGLIRAESEPGKGTTFYVTLPLDATSEGEPCEDPEIADAPESRARPTPVRLDCRVLIAEDSRDIQRFVSRVLERAGATVAIVADGQAACDEALKAWNQGQPFDLILMDVQMPVMDGCQATRRLREAGYRAPIVALTAHALTVEREKCEEAGCDDFAVKPIDHDRLLATVARHVRPVPAAHDKR